MAGHAVHALDALPAEASRHRQDARALQATYGYGDGLPAETGDLLHRRVGWAAQAGPAVQEAGCQGSQQDEAAPRERPVAPPLTLAAHFQALGLVQDAGDVPRSQGTAVGAPVGDEAGATPRERFLR
jgi:hypothetical protein